MQVPHVDLRPGQVQVIVALTATQPTLVYDPYCEVPDREDVLETTGVPPEHADHIHLAMLFSGGAPLTLPAALLYSRMVPACGRFREGDAVQISSGIVHAGPQCKLDGTVPRVVVFSTYTVGRVQQYDVGFQYKFWDWASFAHVPPKVAYARLQEAFHYGIASGTGIEPWNYYRGKSAEACKRLCMTVGLQENQVEELVATWRFIARPVRTPKRKVVKRAVAKTETGQSLAVTSTA